jgi:hypothetical protein
VRDRILHLARTTYAGFNDHHLCEKLVEKEGLSLGRETLRRLLRSAGIGSSRKRRAPAHRQRRLAPPADARPTIGANRTYRCKRPKLGCK